MYEINKEMKSLSIFVGTGKCNAKCGHCAGVPLRKYAPLKDGEINEPLIRETIESCYEKGARSLSISSSGEPTLSPESVTKLLEISNSYVKQGKIFSPVNLYSNGIRIGNDKKFSDKYLPYWKSLGLEFIYITVHSTDEIKNAEIYRIKIYPSIKKIIQRIHDYNLKMRANIVLRKDVFPDVKSFSKIICELISSGADRISAWPVRNLEDETDPELSPDNNELEKMEVWINKNNLEKKVVLLLENSRKNYSSGKKLTLFPDGTLSNKWCNH